MEGELGDEALGKDGKVERLSGLSILLYCEWFLGACFGKEVILGNVAKGAQMRSYCFVVCLDMGMRVFFGRRNTEVGEYLER